MEENQVKMESLIRYRDALDLGDKEIFDKLVSYAKNHVVACANANKLSVFESMLLAMLLEQQKVINQLSQGVPS